MKFHLSWSSIRKVCQIVTGTSGKSRIPQTGGEIANVEKPTYYFRRFSLNTEGVVYLVRPLYPQRGIPTGEFYFTGWDAINMCAQNGMLQIR